MKTRHIFLLLSAITISLTTYAWNNTGNPSPVSDDVSIAEPQSTLVNVSSLDQVKPTELEMPIKIQQFPVLAGKTQQQILETVPEFNPENFFSQLHGLKEITKYIVAKTVETKTAETKQVKSKSEQKIVRISNMPVGRGFLSSQFGIRKDPFHGTARMHKGVDIAAREGAIVSPLGDGEIIYAGHKAGYGNLVEIQHSKTVVTRYAHLKKTLVEVGQQVTIKHQIGLVGQTGRSTGPHLHLEVLFNGEQADPQVYLANHFGSRSKTQVAFVERKDKTTVTKTEEKNVKTMPVVIAKAKPKPSRTLIAKQKPAAKTMTIQVANNESKKVNEYPQITYQDYVNSVNGMFGFKAPDSF